MIEPEALIGQVVDGRWLLVDHLGSGRFGEVYSAEPRHLELAAGAVKVVRPGTDDDRRLILREIEALAELNHDGLLGYRDSGEIHEGVLAGGIYIVTELCDGTLADERGWATSSERFRAELARAVRQVAEALRYLHDRGFIHRDVKPANILRAGDDWKLSDFGLVSGPTEPDRRSDTVRGTAPYLAPETATREGAGPPADVYALGVVIHEALTGTWPYDVPDGRWSGPPVAEGAEVMLSPVVPDEWRPLVELCLSADPKRRPKAEQIAALIPEADPGSSVDGPPRAPSRTRTVETLPPPGSSSSGVSKALLALIGVALLVTLAVVLAVALSGGDGDQADGGDAVPTTPGETAGPDDPSGATDAGETVETGAAAEEGAESDTGFDPTGEAANWVDDEGVLNVFADLILDDDITTPISVRSDGVVIDCAGHTIGGPGPRDVSTLSGRGVSIEGRANVDVTNCRVDNFAIGVFVGGEASEIVVGDSIGEGNAEGFRIETASATLIGNTALSNESGFVIIGGTTGSTLERNLAEGNRLIGFHIQSSSDNELDSNRSVGSEDNFSLLGSHRNVLVANVAEGSFGGFSLNDSNDNTLDENRATGTGSHVGFSVGRSEGNAFTGNTAEGFRQGFGIGPDSPANTFEGNNAVANYLGFQDRSGALGSGTAGTFSTYSDNECRLNEFDSAPPGLCEAP
jgi:parallel beta-helix repeat protein